jgi:hypothetical protein
LAVRESRYLVEGNNLTIRIGFVGPGDPARSQALRRTLNHFQGADSGINNIVVLTGPVVNTTTIGPRLAAYANTDRRLFRMTVFRVADQWSGEAMAPAYMLQWDRGQ